MYTPHGLFYSSRRRHTSYIGDWSSDVCSSDLASFDGMVIEPAALYLFRSVARASHAVAMVRMSAIVLFCFARCIAVSRFGMGRAHVWTLVTEASSMPSTAWTLSLRITRGSSFV